MMLAGHKYTLSTDYAGKSEYSDRELMRFVIKRQTWALEELFHRYNDAGVRFAQRVGMDADLAQEIVAEAFWRVWVQAKRFQPKRGTFGGWFYRIVHNLAIDELRRGKCRLRMEEKLQVQFRAGQTLQRDEWDSLNGRLDALQVKAALARLPEQQRAALELMYADGMTRREISEHLGIPLGTIHTRVRLGKQKLKRLLLEMPLSMTPGNA